MEDINKSIMDVVSVNLQNDLVNPEIRIDKRTGLVKWGEDNLYPDYLLDVYLNKSAVHKKIIDRKVLMTSKNGITFNENNPSLVSFMNNFLSNSGDIEEILQMASMDYYIFNGYSLAIRWSNDGLSIGSIDYIPFHKCRVVGDDIAISSDWSKRWDNNEENIYPRFNVMENKDRVQIYYHIEKGAGVDYYPNISYAPAITSIETEGRIDNYHYNNAKNSFSASYAVVFKSGKPTAEEKRDTISQFSSNTEGDPNAGRVIYLFSHNPDEVPEFIPIPSNGTDELYLSLDKRITTKILSAHGITSPQLFGISTEGMTFTSKGELQEALDIYQGVEIVPIQKMFEKMINKFLYINDIKETITLNSYKITDEENGNV